MGVMSNTALLIMDLQQGIVDRYAEQSGPLLKTLASAATAARAVGVRVLYIRVAFRDGAPEISDRNRTFAALAQAGGFGQADPATAIHPGLAPETGDIVVTKKRVSAFTGSDLEVVLRSLDVDHLVLAGIATSGVVLSTLRQAADLDYRLTVLSDGCADTDPEVHRVLLDKVFPRQAAVLTANEWTATLPSEAPPPA
jgi:nicotinamidase-related amidase